MKTINFEMKNKMRTRGEFNLSCNENATLCLFNLDRHEKLDALSQTEIEKMLPLETKQMLLNANDFYQIVKNPVFSFKKKNITDRWGKRIEFILVIDFDTYDIKFGLESLGMG